MKVLLAVCTGPLTPYVYGGGAANTSESSRLTQDARQLPPVADTSEHAVPNAPPSSQSEWTAAQVLEKLATPPNQVSTLSAFPPEVLLHLLLIVAPLDRARHSLPRTSTQYWTLLSGESDLRREERIACLLRGVRKLLNRMREENYLKPLSMEMRFDIWINEFNKILRLSACLPWASQRWVFRDVVQMFLRLPTARQKLALTELIDLAQQIDPSAFGRRARCVEYPVLRANVMSPISTSTPLILPVTPTLWALHLMRKFVVRCAFLPDKKEEVINRLVTLATAMPVVTSEERTMKSSLLAHIVRHTVTDRSFASAKWWKRMADVFPRDGMGRTNLLLLDSLCVVANQIENGEGNLSRLGILEQAEALGAVFLQSDMRDLAVQGAAAGEVDRCRRRDARRHLRALRAPPNSVHA